MAEEALELRVLVVSDVHHALHRIEAIGRHVEALNAPYDAVWLPGDLANFAVSAVPPARVRPLAHGARLCLPIQRWKAWRKRG